MEAVTRHGTDGIDVRQGARWVAAGAAGLAALLYLMIGFGVASIGAASTGETPDLLSFGLTAGAAFAAGALLVARVRSRIVWIVFGLLDLAVVATYFAVADLREPRFEMWGLLIKACQLVVFVALAYLVVRGDAPRPAADGPGR